MYSFFFLNIFIQYFTYLIIQVLHLLLLIYGTSLHIGPDNRYTYYGLNCYIAGSRFYGDCACDLPIFTDVTIFNMTTMWAHIVVTLIAHITMCSTIVNFTGRYLLELPRTRGRNLSQCHLGEKICKDGRERGKCKRKRRKGKGKGNIS